MKAIIFDWMGTLYEKNKGLYPYSEEVLKNLKQGCKLGLVSIAKSGLEKRKQELESSGIMPYFDSVIVDISKTAEHYLRCMREMGTTPETTAIVDDRTLRGIMIGNQLGCKTFWIQKGEYAHELPNEETGRPTFIINSVKDLLELVNELE